MPAVFLGAIGGFMALGIIGLFVGATIVSVGYKLFLAWLRARPAPEASGRPPMISVPSLKVAGAVVRAFATHGDRTNRQKARLKYVLDRMGREAFIAEVEKEYGQPLRRAAASGGGLW